MILSLSFSNLKIVVENRTALDLNATRAGSVIFDLLLVFCLYTLNSPRNTMAICTVPRIVGRCHMTSLLSVRTCFPLTEQLPGVKQSMVTSAVLPEPPKKPLGPYMKFMKEKHPVIMKQNPSLGSKEIMRKVAELWKQVPEEEKEALKKEYAYKWVIYTEQQEKYNEQLTEEQEEMKQLTEQGKKGIRKAKAVRQLLKEVNLPKKPLTSYLLFMKSMKNQRGDASYLDFQGEISKQWKYMSDEEKRPYREMADKEKVRYMKEISSWNQKLVEMNLLGERKKKD